MSNNSNFTIKGDVTFPYQPDDVNTTEWVGRQWQTREQIKRVLNDMFWIPKHRAISIQLDLVNRLSISGRYYFDGTLHDALEAELNRIIVKAAKDNGLGAICGSMSFVPDGEGFKFDYAYGIPVMQ